MANNINTINAVVAELQTRYPNATITPKTVEKAWGEEIGIDIRYEGKGVAPCIYADDDAVQKAGGITKFVDAIVKTLGDEETLKNTKEMDTDALFDIYDYEKIKDRIIARLINPEKGAGYILDKPSVQFEDMYLTFMIDVSDIAGQGSGMATTAVTNELFSKWNVTKEELFNTAKVNMRKQASVTDLFGMVCELAGDMASELGIEPISEDEAQPYVVTNKTKTNGAAIFPMIIDDLKAKFGSFYMLPSSVHEVIVFPASIVPGTMEDLTAMVQEVNATQVAPEEVLSNHAYYYSVA